MHQTSTLNGPSKPILTTAVVLALALMAGCASAPQPTEQMAVARSAVDSASAEHATEHAPLAMQAAQKKLRQAEAALATGDNAQARRLAEQAEVDALLAERTARTARAERAAAEVQESIRALREANR